MLKFLNYHIPEHWLLNNFQYNPIIYYQYLCQSHLEMNKKLLKNCVDLTELIARNSLVLTEEDIESQILKLICLIFKEGNRLSFFAQ